MQRLLGRGTIAADIARVFVTSRMYVHFVESVAIGARISVPTDATRISSEWVILFERAG